MAQRSEEAVERARKEANAPYREPGPIDRAGEPLHRRAGVAPDDAVRFSAGLERMGEPAFERARLGRQLVRPGGRPFEHLEQPGDEQHVAQACLDRAGPGEQVVGDGIANAAEAKFIPALAFLKQRTEPRSEERRVGQERVSKCRSRWWP